MKCYLCYTNQWHAEFEPHSTIKSAKESFLATARELDKYGQHCSATLHIANHPNEIQEYPDRVLSLSKNGNLNFERT